MPHPRLRSSPVRIRGVTLFFLTQDTLDPPCPKELALPPLPGIASFRLLAAGESVLLQGWRAPEGTPRGEMKTDHRLGKSLVGRLRHPHGSLKNMEQRPPPV